MVRLDGSSTKATFFGDEEHLYVPKAFATEVMGLTVSGETYNHYGVEYVDILTALDSCGKTGPARMICWCWRTRRWTKTRF